MVNVGQFPVTQTRPLVKFAVKGMNNYPVIWRDYIISHYKYLIINQSGFHGSCQGFVAIAHVSLNMAIFFRRTKRGLLAEYESTMPKFNLTGGAMDQGVLTKIIDFC